MDNDRIISALRRDLSVGTERFRDELLRRCLSELDQPEGIPLSDDELDMLAAASGVTPQDTEAGMGMDGWPLPHSNPFWTPGI